MTGSFERLQRSNPVPRVLPAPPIEPVLRALEREAPSPLVGRRHHRGRTRGWNGGSPGYRRPSLGRVSAVLGTAVAVAVAALAIVVLGRGQSTRRTPLPPAPSAAASRRIAAGLAGLRSEFAVFRRPQTAADRMLQVRAGETIPSLTRLARRLPNGINVYLTVYRLVFAQPRRTRYAIDVVVARPTQMRVVQYVSGTRLSAAPWRLSFGPSTQVWVSLVPDAVKLVRWTFHSTAGEPGAVKVPVRGNVAAAPLAGPVASALPGVTWYGRDGHVLLTSGRTAPGAEAATAALAGNGIAGVSFGTVYGDAIVRLDAKLGEHPRRGYSSVRGDCDVDHTATWAPYVSEFFRHGRFVGYQYALSRTSHPHPLLTGPYGLHVGEPIADAARRAGRAFTSSTAQGGSWSLRTPNGRLFGYASEVHGGRIVTIDAGSVGCPAQTP